MIRRTFFIVSLVFTANLVFAQMEFVENKGQWHRNVAYRGDFKTGSFFLEQKGFSVLLHNADDLEKFSERVHGHGEKDKSMGQAATLHSFMYRVKFLGAAPMISQVPEKPFPTYNNYFIGNDKSAWASNCKVFQAVTYKNVYPNIDVRYYSENNAVKYDFVVHPGGNVHAIAMQYDGPQDVTVKDKELIISTSVGDVKELYPYTYFQSPKGAKLKLKPVM